MNLLNQWVYGNMGMVVATSVIWLPVAILVDRFQTKDTK